jgi:hypothetical protein
LYVKDENEVILASKTIKIIKEYIEPDLIIDDTPFD